MLQSTSARQSNISCVPTLKFKWDSHAVFSKYHNSELLSDVVLKTCSKIESEGTKLHCHKLVLCSSSPVFEAMFQSAMSEAQPRSTVVIKEVSHTVLQQLLRFMYGLDVCVPVTEAMDLYALADQYQVIHLRLLDPDSHHCI